MGGGHHLDGQEATTSRPLSQGRLRTISAKVAASAS
jgi:hypothetical protein